MLDKAQKRFTMKLFFHIYIRICLGSNNQPVEHASTDPHFQWKTDQFRDAYIYIWLLFLWSGIQASTAGLN